MKRWLLLGAVLLLPVATIAHAALEQTANEIIEKQRAIDSDRQATDRTVRPLMAGCDLNRALGTALGGDSKASASAFEQAGFNLRKSAEGLRALASKRIFSKQVNISGLRIASPTVTLGGRVSPFGVKEPSAPGDTILTGISELADQSAGIIERMREGKPNGDDLTALVQNNGDIAQLILAFYGILAQRVKG